MPGTVMEKVAAGFNLRRHRLEACATKWFATGEVC
jgi:hypothetical protein